MMDKKITQNKMTMTMTKGMVINQIMLTQRLHMAMTQLIFKGLIYRTGLIDYTENSNAFININSFGMFGVLYM